MTTVKYKVKTCPKCGHDMITAFDSEYASVKGYLKPIKITYIMHHCPNCMELITDIVDDENSKKFNEAIKKKLCKKKHFI